jgi:MFS family permease
MAFRLTGFRVFTIIWFGQLVSMLGTGMTRFAIMIWAYQQTSQATTLALLGFFSGLPMILISPLAGVWVDRLDRRRGGYRRAVGQPVGIAKTQSTNFQGSTPCPAGATGDENRTPSHQAILGFAWPLRALVCVDFQGSSPCPAVATGDENGGRHPLLTRGVRLFSGQLGVNK